MVGEPKERTSTPIASGSLAKSSTPVDAIVLKHGSNVHDAEH
ncbi:hypothetical protein KCP75_23960 [Salmonella enterica subsp. enterica]|nr:hypothetical protein KCP75_23960 [Salmonella enterica subsp. enterica]